MLIIAIEVGSLLLIFILFVFSEFETENDLKLRSKQITFSKHLNHYSSKFQIAIKQLNDIFEQLKSEIAFDHSNFSNQTTETDEKYSTLQNHTEIIYENKMIETVLILCLFD